MLRGGSGSGVRVEGAVARHRRHDVGKFSVHPARGDGAQPTGNIVDRMLGQPCAECVAGEEPAGSDQSNFQRPGHDGECQLAFLLQLSPARSKVRTQPAVAAHGGGTGFLLSEYVAYFAGNCSD